MSEETEAKLEYSTQSELSRDVLWLRKKIPGPDNEGKRRGLLMPIRREDLDALKAAVRQFFGNEVWPNDTCNSDGHAFAKPGDQACICGHVRFTDEFMALSRIDAGMAKEIEGKIMASLSE